MDNDILIVRYGEGYRVLHGYLLLTALLIEKCETNEISVNVKGEGQAKVIRTPKGFVVHHGPVLLPLLKI